MLMAQACAAAWEAAWSAVLIPRLRVCIQQTTHGEVDSAIVCEPLSLQAHAFVAFVLVLLLLLLRRELANLAHSFFGAQTPAGAKAHSLASLQVRMFECLHAAVTIVTRHAFPTARFEIGSQTTESIQSLGAERFLFAPPTPIVGATALNRAVDSHANG